MENIINLIKNSNITETASFFSCEITFIIIFFLNLLLFLIFKRNTKAKRLSDFVTAVAFCFNGLTCCVIYFLNVANSQFSTTFLRDLFYLDTKTVFLKGVINAALLVFLFINYKIIRPTSFKATLLNAYLCLIGVISCFMSQANNELLTFFLFDVIVCLIYKYASSMKLKQNKFFSLDFLLLNLVSSVVFYLALLVLEFNDSDFQIAIFSTVLFLAFMLKIGIFPCVNYFSISNHKKNFPYSVLLYVYLPFLSIISLTKIFDIYIMSGDIFLITSVLFLILCVFSVVILALKTKNISKFFAAVCAFFNIFVIINFLVSQDSYFSLKLASLYMFAEFCVFSLIAIFKINNREEKLYFIAFRGIFLKNRLYALFVSLSILFLFSIVPSALMTNSLFALKNIYSYDKFGYLLVFVLAFGYLTLVLKSFDLILNCYNFDKNSKVNKFIKKTTLNYVAFFMSVLCLFLFLL